MENYIGVKEIKATPMTRIEYNKYRGWELPEQEKGMEHDEGYLVEYLNSPNSNHPKHEGYISWSPKDVFDSSYSKIENDSITTLSEILNEKSSKELDFKERLEIELKQLNAKCQKLNDFIDSEKFEELKAKTQIELLTQQGIMTSYEGILHIRIANL